MRELTAPALMAEMVLIQMLPDESGKVHAPPVTAFRLVHAPDLRDAVAQVLGSAASVDSADSNVNSLNRITIVPVEWGLLPGAWRVEAMRAGV